jgi:hypothetical protein
MGNLLVSDRDPREMRDTANGGGIDGHDTEPLTRYVVDIAAS